MADAATTTFEEAAQRVRDSLAGTARKPAKRAPRTEAAPRRAQPTAKAKATAASNRRKAA